jgi:hypothetical protein
MAPTAAVSDVEIEMPYDVLAITVAGRKRE